MATGTGRLTNHGALMDQVYRRQRYIYDFTRKYYLFGRDTLIAELGLKPGETLVEVGCGTARNLIAIARRYPGARLFGIDASREMLDQATRAISRAGLSGQIRLQHGFAETLSANQFGLDHGFNRVIFPYSLSMIPDWKQSLMAASEALAPGGRVHVADFGDLKGLGPLGATALRFWLRLFHVEPREEIFDALKSLNEQSRTNAGHIAARVLFAHYAFVLSADKKGVLDLVQ